MKPETITTHLNAFARERKNYALCETIIDMLGFKLSDSVVFSPSYYVLITCYNREDLQTLMTLAPRWEKRPSDNSIEYVAEFIGQDLHIKAMEAALPGTCKLVEEEYEVPEEPAKPAVPAHKAVRMVLKCDDAKKAEAEATTEDVPVTDVPFAVEEPL